MRFFQVDVFASAPYTGNPLAVFPDAEGLSGEQMQTIAKEMNLSESSFVTGNEPSSYEVRIFTPANELPFAGHPTLGTAWVLGELGRVKPDVVTQHSAAGTTEVRRAGDKLFFERGGVVEDDLSDSDHSQVAEALGIASEEIGVQLAGNEALLRAAVADAGIPHLLIPVRDEAVLRQVSLPRPVRHLHATGAFCYTSVGEGRIRARAFFPGMGISEDPATGSAAASLGLFLASRRGHVNVELEQGVEMGRPSRLWIEASDGMVKIGGRVMPIFTGELQNLP